MTILQQAIFFFFWNTDFLPTAAESLCTTVNLNISRVNQAEIAEFQANKNRPMILEFPVWAVSGLFSLCGNHKLKTHGGLSAAL